MVRVAHPSTLEWLPPKPASPAYFNAAPTVTLTADPTLVPQSGQTVTLTASGTDPDGDPITYHWNLATKPGGSSSTLSGSGATRTITPDLYTAGDNVYNIDVYVTDDGGAARNPTDPSPSALSSATVRVSLAAQAPPDFGFAGIAGVKKAVGLLAGDSAEDGTSQIGTLFSVSCASNVFTATAHGLVLNGQLKVSVAGSISGVSVDPHVYYAIPVTADTFRMANSYDGAALAVFGNGSGATMKTYAGAVTRARRFAAYVGRTIRYGGCNPGEQSGDGGDVTGTMSGSTLTFGSAHGLAVADRVHNKTTLVAYWVASTPSPTTATLSVVKGGSAVSGSGSWPLKKHVQYGLSGSLLTAEGSTWGAGNGTGWMQRVAIMPLYTTWGGAISNDGQSPPLHVRRARRQEIAAGTWDVTYRAFLDLAHRTPAIAVTGVSATGIITQTGHGWVDGAMVWFTAKTGGSSLSTSTLYKLIRLDANTFKLASGYDNWVAGTAVSLGSNITAGTLKGRNADFRARTNEIDLPFPGGYPGGKLVPYTVGGNSQGVVEPNDENEHKAMVEKIADLHAEFLVPFDYLGDGRNWPSQDDSGSASAGSLWPLVRDLQGSPSTDTREAVRYAFPNPTKLGAVAQNIYMGPPNGYSTPRAMQIVRGVQGFGVEKGLPVGFGEHGVYVWKNSGPTPCTWVAGGKFTAPSGSLASNGITSGTRVVISQQGTIPGGVGFRQAYYVRDIVGDAFNVASTSGGSAISLSGAFVSPGTTFHVANGVTDNTKFVDLTGVTASGSTFTKTAHGLTVNQVVTLWTLGTLTGFSLYQNFIVKTVPNANTFTLALWPRLAGNTVGPAVTVSGSPTGIEIVDGSDDAYTFEWQFWQFFARCPAYPSPGSLLYSNYFDTGDNATTQVNDTDLRAYMPSTFAAIYSSATGLLGGA